jgi:hypothetical protein
VIWTGQHTANTRSSEENSPILTRESFPEASALTPGEIDEFSAG